MRAVTVLRKPLEGTVAQNCLEHGTGALNIDGCRVGTSKEVPASLPQPYTGAAYGAVGERSATAPGQDPNVGRWPANVILQHLEGCRRDGVKKVKPGNGSGRAGEGSNGFRAKFVGGKKRGDGFTGDFVDKDGKETVANWVCAEGCPVADLDAQSGYSVSPPAGNTISVKAHNGFEGKSFSMKALPNKMNGHGDAGGSSRFFKQVKE